jgi:RHS repeat-associated protein
MTLLTTGAVDQAPSRRAVIDSYEYDAFGNQITHTGSTPNNYLYRGEQWDSDLGLYYLRARYYNPLTGRFMSRDPEDGTPFDPKTLHKYLYAKGDPVDVIDPSGREGLLEGVYVEVITDIPWITTAAKVSLVIGGVFCKAADILSWASTHLAGGPSFELPEPLPLFCLTR